MPDFEIISTSSIFKGIELEAIKSLFDLVVFQVRNYKKGDLVASAGEEINAFFMLQKGSVRGEMMNFSGKVIKIEDIEAPRVIASAFLFGKRNKFPVTVIANEYSEIIIIFKEEFIKLLQLNNLVLGNYLDAISSRAQFLSEKLQFLSFKTIKGKIAHFLLESAGDRYHSIEIKQTQQQLADLFGVTRPSLARVLRDLQDEKLINVERKTISLIDKEGLNKYLYNG